MQRGRAAGGRRPPRDAEQRRRRACGGGRPRRPSQLGAAAARPAAQIRARRPARRVRWRPPRGRSAAGWGAARRKGPARKRACNRPREAPPQTLLQPRRPEQPADACELSLPPTAPAAASDGRAADGWPHSAAAAEAAPPRRAAAARRQPAAPSLRHRSAPRCMAARALLRRQAAAAGSEANARALFI